MAHIHEHRGDAIEPVSDDGKVKEASTVAVDDSKDAPDPESQAGVQQADAITLVWTKASLILAYSL